MPSQQFTVVTLARTIQHLAFSIRHSASGSVRVIRERKGCILRNVRFLECFWNVVRRGGCDALCERDAPAPASLYGSKIPARCGAQLLYIASSHGRFLLNAKC